MIDSADRAKAQNQLAQLSNEQLSVMAKEYRTKAYSVNSEIMCEVEKKFYSKASILVEHEIERRANIMLSDALTNKLGCIA